MGDYSKPVQGSPKKAARMTRGMSGFRFFSIPGDPIPLNLTFSPLKMDGVGILVPFLVG